jgi:hypothetical protein
MTLDLSAVTDSLIGLVKSQWAAAPMWAEVGGNPAGPTFTPNFTGLAPDAARQEPGTQLSMYLYHVESDNAQETLFWQDQILHSPAGAPTRFVPLALDLFYLLFAYSDTSYTQEQEAMSVALRVFHANPIVRSDPGAAEPWELTLTMEHRSYDELSRLWQATTAPLRMSLVFRAAVVFIDPDAVPQPAAKTKSFTVTADPVSLPLPPAGGDGYPVLFGTFRDGSYANPDGTLVPLRLSPATVAPGQTAWLTGAGLSSALVSEHMYLLQADGSGEVDVTSWVAAANSSAEKLVFTVPTATGTPPAGAPAAGVYQLRAGSGALGAAGATRSGSVPVSIAASVNAVGGPVLPGPAPYTVHGAGFVPGATEVLAGAVVLTATAATPAPGEVSIDPSGISFSFSPPAGPAGMLVPIQVRVNGIESDPALWVTL